MSMNDPYVVKKDSCDIPTINREPLRGAKEFLSEFIKEHVFPVENQSGPDQAVLL